MLLACGSDPSASTAGDGETDGSSGTTQNASSWTTAGTTAEPTTSTNDEEASAGPTDDGPTVDCGPVPAATEVLLIDDLESGDTALPEHEGRRGWWFTFNDATGGEQHPSPFTATDEDAHGGEWSVHTWGEGFNEWGAALAVAFNGSVCPYDVSAFRGVEFWARGEGRIRFSIPTTATRPVAEGGSCVGECYDDYGRYIQLTDDWTHFELPWTALSQEGWGTDADFDPGQVRELIWQDLAALSFDIWVDDVAFLPASAGEESSTGGDESTGGSSTGDDTGSSGGSEASSG